MEQITIYVSEVIRYLPQKSQSEIKKELTTNILDMVDELTAGGMTEKDAVASVLSKMGNPRLLADQYLDKKAYLIGPRYYPTYLMIAKIVSGAVALGITIALSVQYLFSTDASLIQLIIQWLGSVFMGVIQAIAWVTLIFAGVERFEEIGVLKNVDVDLDDWSIKDLPKSQRNSKKSDRIEGLVGFLFALIFLLLLNTNLELFGVYMFDQGTLQRIIPVFNLQNATTWVPLLSVAIVFTAISDGITMAIRNQTRNTIWFRLTLNLLSFIFVAYVLIYGNIFNADLAVQIAPNNAELQNLWTWVQRNVIVIIVIANLIGMATQVFKIARFNEE
ncbi:MAG: permease prefix domain 1-containing protein [Erysipelotrichaceae bacterium]|nr:permease prefix domain 1-containing protein [Erysipelotrichaceae bacterium]